MTAIKKWIKMTVLDFKGNFYYAHDGGNESFWDQNQNF